MKKGAVIKRLEGIPDPPKFTEDELLAKKKKLESDIAGLVAGFARETGVLVSKVKVFNDRIIFDDYLTVPAIDVKVKLLD